jgi:hypothetical protein
VRAPIPPLLLVLTLILPALGCLIDPSNHFPPGDTLSLLALWAWCGYQLLVQRVSPVGTGGIESVSSDHAALAAKFAELGADVGGAHEGLTD